MNIDASEAANADPYSFTMNRIRQALEHSLHPSRKGKMSTSEYNTVRVIRLLANELDPDLNIQTWE